MSGVSCIKQRRTAGRRAFLLVTESAHRNDGMDDLDGIDLSVSAQTVAAVATTRF